MDVLSRGCILIRFEMILSSRPGERASWRWRFTARMWQSHLSSPVRKMQCQSSSYLLRLRLRHFLVSMCTTRIRKKLYQSHFSSGAEADLPFFVGIRKGFVLFSPRRGAFWTSCPEKRNAADHWMFLSFASFASTFSPPIRSSSASDPFQSVDGPSVSSSETEWQIPIPKGCRSSVVL